MDMNVLSHDFEDYEEHERDWAHWNEEREQYEEDCHDRAREMNDPASSF